MPVTQENDDKDRKGSLLDGCVRGKDMVDFRQKYALNHSFFF
jgi:hypothetical protein